MQDRVPLYPGRVKLNPVSGQENTYDMVRADEPTQEGDPLNKATFLKDATASMFGLGADAVPDDVLSLINTLIDNLQSSVAIRAKIQTGYYVGTGAYGSTHPCSLMFDFEPEFVFVFRYNSAIAPFHANDTSDARTDCMIWLNKSSCEMNAYSTNISSFDESTNTLSWYIENPGNYVEAQMQLNMSKTTYKYIAVG